MLKIPFVKYQGAGNDFIMIDDRTGLYGPLMNEHWIARACDRRFGIGADGLILIQQGGEGVDFFMKYYNADGRTSTFCGNGGRCVFSFASRLGIHHGQSKFLGTDGMHEARFTSDGNICLSMTDVMDIKQIDHNTYELYTGSPHLVMFVDDLEGLNVAEQGRSIRISPPYNEHGINVNFVVSGSLDEIFIRTYERGVEDETLACGTGVVAAAIANSVRHMSNTGETTVHARGGDLKVQFARSRENVFTNVRLTGPATEVFSGEIEL